MCVRKMNHRKMPFRTITCRDYSKYNHTVPARDIENYDWNSVYTETNVNMVLDYMEQGLISIIDRHTLKVTRRVKGRKCPWLTCEIKTLMYTRGKVLRKARKTNEECDWSSYKGLKNLCNNKIKQVKQKYQKDLLFKNRNKPTKFWNCIKEMFLSKEFAPISVTTRIDNVKNTENANSICTLFTNIAQNLKYETFKLRPFIWEKPPTLSTSTKSFNFSYVSRIFVEAELKSLKRRKAAGCDDLSPGILKDAAYSLSGPLTHLIKSIVNNWTSA